MPASDEPHCCFVPSRAEIHRPARSADRQAGPATYSGAAVNDAPKSGANLRVGRFLGDPMRFIDVEALASYVGMIRANTPARCNEQTRRRTAAVEKSGVETLLSAHAEAERIGQSESQEPGKLGIRLWIMMRGQIDYEEFCRRGKAR
jgi:hypothetical protein